MAPPLLRFLTFRPLVILKNDFSEYHLKANNVKFFYEKSLFGIEVSKKSQNGIFYDIGVISNRRLKNLDNFKTQNEKRASFLAFHSIR